MKTDFEDIRFLHPGLLSPLRYVLLFTVVIAAYDVGRAVLTFIEFVRKPGMDMLLVILWLLSAPLIFVATVCLFYTCKRLREGYPVTMPITIGFGAMVLCSVSNLISQVNILDGNGLSIVILCAISLVCYVIIFLYFQHVGTKILTWFAAVMNILCSGYFLLNGIKLVIEQPEQLLGYLFTSYMAAFMIAISILLFTLTVGIDVDDVDIMEAD